MNTSFIQFFSYGQVVQLKVKQKKQQAYMSFCGSNYSFIEFVSPQDFSVVRFVNLFHIRNTRLEKETKVLVRLRDYHESFRIYAETREEALRVKGAIDALTVYLFNYPFCEFSV